MSKRELVYAAAWAAGVMLLTCAPYAVAWWYTPLQSVYPWVLYNADDHGVYFAWMRQAHDGHLFFRNLFTNDSQRGAYVHLYFLALGALSRLPGLDIPTAYHLGRFVCGTAALIGVYRLAAFFTTDVFARRCAFWTTVTASGLGWLYWRAHQTTHEPVDVWMPEAVTFPSLYTNGLFCAGLALMLGVVICLLEAEERGWPGGWRWAAGAGACGFLLGNIHSYDVIHLTAVWAAYLMLRWAMGRRFPLAEVRLAFVAAAVAAPSVAYMAWLYLAEPVFKKRADVPTPSPLLWQYLMGYGLLLPLALGGALLLHKRGAAKGAAFEGDRLRVLLPVGWAVVAIPLAYLPFAFQRKLIMGGHLPLALLAGLAVAELARRAVVRRPQAAGWVAALLLLPLSITNVLFFLRDAQVALKENLSSTGTHPVYWPEELIRSYQRVERETPKDAALLTWPTHGVIAPLYAGRAVYAGHWGETPQFADRFTEARQFYGGVWTSAERLRFLQDRGITHVLLEGPVEAFARGHTLNTLRRPLVSPVLEREPWLAPVFREGATTLYAVRPPAAGSPP